ncbi:3,4-dihydroxy-2-butanone 4-phosphate synthase [Campylobacterota bacterium]|nr:3,4-dihydroxy-2-butanone 4-phosphate synthase [Campylobacterota bacterium]
MQNSDAITRVTKAIETIKTGKMVLMIDDEDRENEGDLVYAGALSTPELVNFMVSEARGLVCVALERQHAQRLDLQPMVAKNTSGHETAFTVTVDAKSASTGVSAYERHDTIKILTDPFARPDDLVRPGHIFPLIGKDGGVLVRTGHTEGSLDLCRLAGLLPVGVICEVLKPDGTMARRPDLDIFCAKHDIPIVYIADLIEYRLRREQLVQRVKTEERVVFGVGVTLSYWLDHFGRTHRAVQFGETKSETFVKFHAVRSDADLLLDSTQLNGILQAIDLLKTSGGVLLFINEGSQNAQKEFGVGAQILIALGVTRLTLLATQEIAAPVALGGFGLEISQTVLLA